MRNTSTSSHSPGRLPELAVVGGEAGTHLFPLPQRIGKSPDDGAAARHEEAWLALIEASCPAHRRGVRAYPLVKRGCDIAVAGVALVALSPLFALAALAIRCESGGPVVFRQARVGKDGGLFTMYKFRTMIPDRRATPTGYPGAERRRAHKTKADPRVTRVGRVLRRTSIDELPQLVNVLRGEMSLIGPRPELPQIVARYAPWQHLRHRVEPGMTGWWQVQGRSDLPMHEHTELDVYYVVHRSFALDMTILFRTFRAVLQRSGAF